MSNDISYSEIDELLRTMKSGMSASELHGMLTAWICGRGSHDNAWQRDFFHGEAVVGRLDDVCELIVRQLTDERFVFELLLPDEEDKSLTLRAEALVLWCQGFLSGLGLTGIDIKLFPNLQEGINDLSEISKLDFAALAEQEDDEVSLMEVVEYVRTIAMLAFVEMQLKPTGTGDDKERFH